MGKFVSTCIFSKMRKPKKYELSSFLNTQNYQNRSNRDEERYDQSTWTVRWDSPWGCLKIHVDLFKNKKTKKFELSTFQNIKNYQNQPNSDEERCDWSWGKSAVFGLNFLQNFLMKTEPISRTRSEVSRSKWPSNLKSFYLCLAQRRRLIATRLL